MHQPLLYTTTRALPLTRHQPYAQVCAPTLCPAPSSEALTSVPEVVEKATDAAHSSRGHACAVTEELAVVDSSEGQSDETIEQQDESVEDVAKQSNLAFTPSNLIEHMGSNAEWLSAQEWAAGTP